MRSYRLYHKPKLKNENKLSCCTSKYNNKLSFQSETFQHHLKNVNIAFFRNI